MTRTVEPIQGLWIGAELSMMEVLSITSFLRHGHDYHLYVYGDVAHIPPGTVIKDGNAILPATMIFQYRDFATYAGFANFFRYKLLWDKGGWWADTDVVCLQPFDFQEAYVFSTEAVHGAAVITAGVIKAPAASAVMQYAWHTCQTKNPAQLVWGEVGARLMAEAVKTFALEHYAKPPEVFCPFGYGDWEKVLEAHLPWALPATTYAVHLWNDMWRRHGCDKNQRFHPHCLYEQLKRRYVEPAHADRYRPGTP